MTAARVLATFGAAIGTAALILQFVNLNHGMAQDGATAVEVIWRYFGYFTILTNLFVTLIWAAAALNAQRSVFNAPSVEAAAAVAIAMVGIVYHLLLAPLWAPQGWNYVADVAVHTVTPLLYTAYWLARPHGALRWRDALLCMVWPLCYCAYALARGAADGWYAYPFLNPATTPLPQLAINIVGQCLGFAAAALVLVGVDKALAPRARSAPA